VARIIVEAAGRADVLRAPARYKEVALMTDKISQRPVPPFNPPERFAGVRWWLRLGARWTCPPTPGGT
jgi:hypothetical protein